MSHISNVRGEQPIQRVGSSSNYTGAKEVQKDNGSIFSGKQRGDALTQKKEPAKWLRPGSYDINTFSKSTGYVGDVKCTVYTDESGNKYAIGSVGDLVLLNKVKSGNLFRRARYEMIEPEYRKMPDEYEDTRSNYKEELQQFGFKKHPAKKDIGTITVNGENMMVIAGPKGIELIREASSDPSSSPDIKSTTYHNLEELKTALKNKDNDWGKYNGIQNINDYFIP